jgi:type II secretory pathway pseudopilin PulG
MRRCGLRSVKLQITNRKSQIQQRGYMMITLMLALALIMIGLLAVLPEIKQQIVRDREDELRHRGTAYMRAIQHFYKKFGRYPTRVEELESTNNLRFLRKRYTDPVNIDKTTGKEKDFKFLHQQDISLNSGMVLGQTPGTNLQGGASSLLGAAQGAGGFGGAGAFGGAQGGIGGLGAQTGGSQQPGTQNSAGGSSGSAASGDSSDSSSSGTDAAGNSNSSGSSATGLSSNSISSSNLAGQTLGGGPILGVASASKQKSIHVFYTKNHYNDWLFIYLPMADRGGLLNGPVNPTGGVTSGIPGAVTPGMPGMPGGMPGQGGFGQSSLGPGGSQGLGGQSPQSPAPQTPSQPPQQ